MVAVVLLERVAALSLPKRSRAINHAMCSLDGTTTSALLSRWGYRTLLANAKRRGTALTMGTTKNWDAILAEEDGGGVLSKVPVDMVYNRRNCERCNKNYVAIKGAGGPAADLYVCVATADKEAVFWFLGKVAHVSDVSLEQCIARQWPLIQQHAANLRPLDLFPAVTSQTLDLWCAPADSEFDVAYNRPSCTFTKMEQDVPGAAGIKANLIGFQGEVYDRGEEGFRTWRLTANGMPSRPEIKGPVDEEPVDEEYEGDDDDGTEARAPTDEEMERIQKALEGMDINDVYKEQERRTEADSSRE